MLETRIQKCVVYPMTWALTLGAVGFVCGFLGPIFLNPSANQGPLLGIFFTGPLGLVVGTAVGLAFALANAEVTTQLVGLALASVLAATCVLTLSLPEPRYVGTVIDAEYVDCFAPGELGEEAISRWEGAVSETTWRSPRPRWRESSREMLRNSEGVVLELRILAEFKIYRGRRPWNRGQLKAKRSRREEETGTYFARFRGPSCESYSTVVRRQYLLNWEASRQWPSDLPSSFLGLYELRDVPRYLAASVARVRER
ncbi:MAG: hypothetical protein AAF368_05095 [Planctomycetota bacterium]